MGHNAGNLLPRRRRLISLVAFGAGLAVLGAGAADAQTPPPPVVLQVIAVSANLPDSQHTVTAGQVYFDPNTKILGYCLASADTKVNEACTTADLTTILSSNDTGPAGGRAFDERVDAGGTGSLVESGGKLVPVLEPTVFITRIATVDQSYDGVFAFPLSITRDTSTGEYVPAIGSNF